MTFSRKGYLHERKEEKKNLVGKYSNKERKKNVFSRGGVYLTQRLDKYYYSGYKCLL